MDETFDAFLALSADLCALQVQQAVLVTLVRTAGKGQAVGRRAWALPDGNLRGTLTLGSCATGPVAARNPAHL